jgi:RHS repeat-associated protein
MSNPQQPWLIRYRYDPLDRLTSHTQSDIPERHRFYCKNRLATEIQGAVGHSIVQHGDLLLAQQQRHSDGLDTNLLATDLQRSVLHTLKSDRQPQPIAYSPYGHRPAESGLTSLLGFNGERPDAVTGHYLLGNGYRAFNPVLMRFNSPDSLSPFGKGGLNAYVYCLGDPVNKIDPNGQSAIGSLIGYLTRRMVTHRTVFKIDPKISVKQAMRAKKDIKLLNKQRDELGSTMKRLFDADEKKFRDTLQANSNEHGTGIAISREHSSDLSSIAFISPEDVNKITADFYKIARAKGRVDQGSINKYIFNGDTDSGAIQQNLAVEFNKKIKSLRDRQFQLDWDAATIHNKHFLGRGFYLGIR